MRWQEVLKVFHAKRDLTVGLLNFTMDQISLSAPAIGSAHLVPLFKKGNYDLPCVL